MRVLLLLGLLGACFGQEQLDTDGEAGDGLTDEQRGYGTVIGIDLGTTYSCVGVYKDDKVEIIPNEQGNRITPSFVAFTKEGRLIGDAAKNQAASNPTNTVFDAKRLIGRRFTDETVQKDIKLWPFEIANDDGKPKIEVEYKGKKQKFLAEEVSAMVLGKMKGIAEAYLGKEVTHAVVTVPAYFDDAQRAATKDAGTIAGLNVLRIINEPTAAAIAYGLNRQNKDSHVIVYDLGGGTFDVSLLTLDEGVFEVVATNGDTHLGGEDFDESIVSHFVKIFKKKYKVNVKQNLRALAKLRREAEKAKRALSTATTTRVEIEALAEGVDFSESLTRAKFEELNIQFFKKTLKPLTVVLKDAGMEKDEIDEVVMCGGSTRIPKIQSLVRDFFNGKEPNRGINPDEAVAYGAAVQGGILSGAASGKNKDFLLLDVTPLSLGIETSDGSLSVLIEKNSVIPTKKTSVFTTDRDDQTQVVFPVYQGERYIAKDNIMLGKFELKGLTPAPRGVPKLDVTFAIDANGILNVEARDRETGLQEGITITADRHRPSQDEIDKMLEAAQKFEEEDAKRKKDNEARRSFEGMVMDLKSAISDPDRLGDNITEADSEYLSELIDEAQQWIRENPDADREDYNEKLSEFKEVTQPLIKKYKEGAYDKDDL